MTEAMTGTELQPAGVGFGGSMSLQAAKERYEALKKFTKDMMVEGRDYGVIPGTGGRKVLLKPGAEKLTWFFGLRSEFQAVEVVQDWDKGFFAYRYKCRLLDRLGCVAEGEGACNSMEKKYRYRTAYEDTLTDEDRAHVVREEIRKKRGAGTYKVFQILNDDPYSLVNTFIKMAMKRALIAAILIAANASDYFNNDEHDEDAIGAEGGPPGDQGESRPRTRRSEGEGDAVQYVTVRIKSVGEKPTTGAGGAKNTLFSVDASDGNRYSTFDTKDGDLLKTLTGKMVEIGFVLNAKGYRNIDKGNVRPVEESAAAEPAGSDKDRIRIFCSTPAPAEWRKRLAGAGFACGPDGLTWTANETDESSVVSEEAGREPWFKRAENIAGGVA